MSTKRLEKIFPGEGDGGADVTITVRRANAEMDVERWQMKFAADEYNKAHADESDARKTLRVSVYPECIAATEKVQGLQWPLAFDSFRDLDAELASWWLTSALICNPTWAIGKEGQADGAGEKKESSSSS